MIEQVLPLPTTGEATTLPFPGDPSARRVDLGKGPLDGLRTATDLSACLLPLIEALGWRGDPRHIAEAIPHFSDSLDITDLANILANLGFRSRRMRARLDEIDSRLTPYLFVPDGRAAIVVLGVEAGSLDVFDGETGVRTRIPPHRWHGEACFFEPVQGEAPGAKPREKAWFRGIIGRFRSLIGQVLGITLGLNLLALAIPLFVMAVYDRVVPTGSVVTLTYLAIGIAIALVSDVLLRAIRTRMLAFVGARLDNILGNAAFQRILFLPPSLTEGSTIGAQIARIKSFEAVREAFTGPLALVLLELPFAVLFVIVIGIIGGPVAFVPMAMIGLFALLGIVIGPIAHASVARMGRASSERQEFIVETLPSVRTIKHCGTESVWLERFRHLSADAAMAGFRNWQISSLVMTLSHVLMIGAGVATISFSVIQVLHGEMTLGALVASMILVWRVLAPLQTGFIAISRINQVRSGINQINALMSLRPERAPTAMKHPLRRMAGRVTFGRVSLRYKSDADPALVGVDFDVRPGEVVAIVGGNGSGKSTLLKLILGIYAPQAGSIQIDGRDIRQIDPIELRHAIAYAPQECQFFYGSIAQNLRLAHPLATDEDLRWAARKAGALDEILALEQGSGEWRRTGFDVRIGDSASKQIPTSLQQRLNLARAYLKRAAIMLFDEPATGLDFDADRKFVEAVEAMKGRTTVFIVTHRPSHIHLADKIVWFENGHVVAAGPADEVKKHIPKDFL